MGYVIQITFHEDLGTAPKNALRYALEMGVWRERHRKATEMEDWLELDRLDAEYELIGLP